MILREIAMNTMNKKPHLKMAIMKDCVPTSRCTVVYPSKMGYSQELDPIGQSVHS